MTNFKHSNIYGLFEKSFCGASGGIVGYVLGGTGLILVGIAAGVLIGFLLKRTATEPSA